jgi:hypothetical protein
VTFVGKQLCAVPPSIPTLRNPFFTPEKTVVCTGLAVHSDSIRIPFGEMNTFRVRADVENPIFKVE